MKLWQVGKNVLQCKRGHNSDWAATVPASVFYPTKCVHAVHNYWWMQLYAKNKAKNGIQNGTNHERKLVCVQSSNLIATDCSLCVPVHTVPCQMRETNTRTGLSGWQTGARIQKPRDTRLASMMSRTSDGDQWQCFLWAAINNAQKTGFYQGKTKL